jgi:hypothetical protein
MQRTKDFYAAQGFERAYVWAHHNEVPFSRLRKPLKECRLGIVTTAALYDRKATDTRSTACARIDPAPQQLWGNDLAWDKTVTHMNDIGSFFPLEALKAIVAAGILGGLTNRFCCVPTDYSQRRTTEVDAPQILDWLREDGADIALLVPL